MTDHLERTREDSIRDEGILDTDPVSAQGMEATQRLGARAFKLERQWVKALLSRGGKTYPTPTELVRNGASYNSGWLPPCSTGSRCVLLNELESHGSSCKSREVP